MMTKSRNMSHENEMTYHRKRIDEVAEDCVRRTRIIIRKGAARCKHNSLRPRNKTTFKQELDASHLITRNFIKKRKNRDILSQRQDGTALHHRSNNSTDVHAWH